MQKRAISEHVVQEFRSVLAPDAVLTSATDCTTYECDAYTIERQAPDIVLLPSTREQVVAIVGICHREQLPFTPRGAGTSLAGGSVPVGGGVMICLTRMNKILEVDLRNRFAIVEPGVVNQWLTNRIAKDGFHYAPDPSSQSACTIGGNVATNSGGPHTLKYGVTVNHVLGVEMVLPDGNVVQFGGTAGPPAGLDLAGLIVGSEGTLGICTRVWVRITRNPQATRTLLGVFNTVDDASQTISDIIAAGIVPAALEMMDQLIIQAVEEAFHFGFPLDAAAVLIMEVDGIEAGMADLVDQIAEIANRNNAREVRRARDESERAALWKCRKKAFGAIGRLSPSLCCQDGVVPRSKLPQMLRFIAETGAKHMLRIANVFHAGDGNMHPILLFDERDPAQVDRVIAASHDILQECLDQGGSVTGEHGIGIEKLSFMERMFTKADLTTMEKIRTTFNPFGLCNPNKMLPTSGHCVESSLPAVRRAV